MACTAREEAVKKAVKDAMYERVEVEYRNLRYYPGEIACGEYGTTDKWGKETSSQDFIVRNGRADTRPSTEDLQIFCTENSAMELKALHGIDWGNPSVDAIYKDLKTFDNALKEYLADNHLIPTPKQGLEALVSEPEFQPRPMKYREGGYLKTLPKDPWGRDYLYKPSAFGGVAKDPNIQTLGADGAEGGKGENTDIGSQHLKYLHHMATL